MKVFKNVVCFASVAIGLMFLLNSVSDIQLGSGLILVVIGSLGIQN